MIRGRDRAVGRRSPVPGPARALLPTGASRPPRQRPLHRQQGQISPDVEDWTSTAILSRKWDTTTFDPISPSSCTESDKPHLNGHLSNSGATRPSTPPVRGEGRDLPRSAPFAAESPHFGCHRRLRPEFRHREPPPPARRLPARRFPAPGKAILNLCREFSSCSVPSRPPLLSYFVRPRGKEKLFSFSPSRETKRPRAGPAWLAGPPVAFSPLSPPSGWLLDGLRRRVPGSGAPERPGGRTTPPAPPGTPPFREAPGPGRPAAAAAGAPPPLRAAACAARARAPWTPPPSARRRPLSGRRRRPFASPPPGGQRHRKRPGAAGGRRGPPGRHRSGARPAPRSRTAAAGPAPRRRGPAGGPRPAPGPEFPPRRVARAFGGVRRPPFRFPSSLLLRTRRTPFRRRRHACPPSAGDSEILEIEHLVSHGVCSGSYCLDQKNSGFERKKH